MTSFATPDPYSYHHGLGSLFESEAIPGALPTARNSPQTPPLGLYAEKLSGSAFTAPRHSNRQTWLYRILPSASHSPFTPFSNGPAVTATGGLKHIPNQLRWDPFDVDREATFVTGMRQLAGAGDIATKNGLAIYAYSCGRSMPSTQAFCSADGDMLVVPQTGELDVRTELGRLFVRPCEILVVPRGIRFNVALHTSPATTTATDTDTDTDINTAVEARGYILETFAAQHFELPELGPIGSNGLANARDFQIPRADYVDAEQGEPELTTIVVKFCGALFEARQPHSAFDVVAWHGNYYPFKYDLGRFNTIGTISYDHPDPSIFTVLTVPSSVTGTAVADFVVFPPRWLVGEDTFRPPWYHRNAMSEFMGLIRGDYDAKTAGGFLPGGASLHNVMAGHGPDAATAEAASTCPLPPTKVSVGGLAFMFESVYMVGITPWALDRCGKLQPDYSAESWARVRRRFKAPPVS